MEIETLNGVGLPRKFVQASRNQTSWSRPKLVEAPRLRTGARGRLGAARRGTPHRDAVTTASRRGVTQSAPHKGALTASWDVVAGYYGVVVVKVTEAAGDPSSWVFPATSVT
jgi:hypothetical protein